MGYKTEYLLLTFFSVRLVSGWFKPDILGWNDNICD
jgi:hypothetical protein